MTVPFVDRGPAPHRRPPGARVVLGAFGVLAAVVGGACSDSAVTDVERDASAPALTLAPAVAADSTIGFSVSVVDGLGIKYVDVAVSGGVTASFADTIRVVQTEFTRSYDVAVPRGAAAGTAVRVIAQAEDGAGNRSTPDTLDLAVGNVAAPTVRITSPASGTLAVSGKNVLLAISARSALKIRVVGFEVTGAFTTADSSRFSSPLADSVAVVDTLVVPANVTGDATVTPFTVDSLDQRVLGSPVTLSIQSPSSVTSVPTVDFGLTRRVETRDTIQVSASDLSGITVLGYEVRDAAGAVVATDSAVSDGRTTPLFNTFRMALPGTTFPTRLFVQAFARNGSAARTRAYAGGTTPRVDSILVVAGATHTLPNGGRVADAYFHNAKDRVYLSNIDRNRIEVFNVGAQTFAGGIDVGSRPSGLAPWPRSRGGTAGDTLLVANSGGTTISYVDLNVGGADGGREVYRYGLPNIVAYSVTTELSATTSLPIKVRRVYDFSDRPQYIGANCTGGLGAADPCGDVILVYSTQPTAGQTDPFPNRGTVRWENLTTRSSHLFFEQAIGQTAGRADTLEVERFAAKDSRGAFLGADSVLVPASQLTSGGNLFSVVFRLDDLAFRDTTFLRSSGNFRRSIVAEGGAVINSRALYYDATSGFQPGPTPTSVETLSVPVIDRGVSRSTDVSDFIANTSTDVYGAAINFDGELAAIRGNSSTAIVGTTLRLQGLMSTTASNAGFDFHPLNSGTNSSAATRLAFTASAEPQIDIFDTFCYQRVAVIPIRDPIIGPIKSARRANGQIVLVGATTRGVVVTTLDDTFASTCQRP